MLWLKLLLVPSLMAAVTLAGRRWGPAVAGVLVGLPLTSAPVVFLLALEHGTAFAAQSAVGVLVGLVPLGSFYLAYGLLARRARWPACAAAGWCAYLVAALALRAATPPRLDGDQAVVRLIRGMGLASFTFAAFFLVLAELLERRGTAAAFGVAIAVATVMHGVLLTGSSTRPTRSRLDR